MTDQTAPPKETMQNLLASMGQLGASDLHLKVGNAPYYRIAGQLRKVHMPTISDSKYLEAMLIDLIPEARREEFHAGNDLDFSARGATGDRYRVNTFRAMGELHAAIRRVQSKIPTFEDLSLPPIYRETISKHFEGLVLISGVTGCGKSSTLAALIEHINETRSAHIVTIEDPVEYVFTPKKSIISQREIGIDVPDYVEALRFVVRQDPNCILIGELRDKVTMEAALQAAETGHLVLGTLHVADAQQTFSRILEFFPNTQHNFIRSLLAGSLKAIFCQRLVPGIDENTRFPATEVLLNNSVVKDKILRKEDDDIPSIISKSKQDGMRSFTQSLFELIDTEKVHYDTAMEFAPSREALSSAVKGIST
ncbi:MAG: PilT/PilU family type 4a pilus ATPase [Phycisphaerales bacterium]|nr:MAG: PilT/PilU family type 4a pilus ATPase [Phycisphaerales bacterium]